MLRRSRCGGPSANRRSPRGCAAARSSAWRCRAAFSIDRRLLAADSRSPASRMHEGDEHSEVVVIAEKLRQAARLAGARRRDSRARHVPAAPSAASAAAPPCATRETLRRSARRRPRGTRGAPGGRSRSSPAPTTSKPLPVDVQLGEALLGVGETALRFLQAAAARPRRSVAAIRSRRLPTRPLRPDAGGAFELVDRLEQHVPVARARQAGPMSRAARSPA